MQATCINTCPSFEQNPPSFQAMHSVEKTKVALYSAPTQPKHLLHNAPSSDQISLTPTQTDPDLHLTPTHHNLPHLPTTPNMNTPSSFPHDQAQEMANLEQIWSSLSLGRSNDETVTYVWIPVHPQTALAWNQVTQTPSLPMRLEPPPRILPTKYHGPMSECAAQCTHTKPRQDILELHQYGSGALK